MIGKYDKIELQETIKKKTRRKSIIYLV